MGTAVMSKVFAGGKTKYQWTNCQSKLHNRTKCQLVFSKIGQTIAVDPQLVTEVANRLSH